MAQSSRARTVQWEYHRGPDSTSVTRSENLTQTSVTRFSKTGKSAADDMVLSQLCVFWVDWRSEEGGVVEERKRRRIRERLTNGSTEEEKRMKKKE